MNQNETVSMLKEVYQSSKTAIDAISILISKAQSQNFRTILEKQLDKYRSIADESVMLLSGYRELPDDTSVFSKLGLWSAVEMNTVTNKNPEHMAEIMINGCTMGIIDISRFIHHNNEIDQYALDLGNRLIALEREHIDIMREYL